MGKKLFLVVFLILSVVVASGISGPFSPKKAWAEGKPNQEDREYTVESSINDDTFVINGHAFKAKSFCTNILDGDRVIFLKGRADGYCDTATLFNVRTGKKCEVVCEGR